MSKSIHPYWIRETVLDLLSVTDAAAKSRRVRGTRCIQVTAVLEDIRSIVVSDGDVLIHAFLTEACFESFTADYSIDTLKYGQANLVDYCFSTVTQAAGNQDMNKLTAKGILFPLALHCFKVQFLGASDCSIIGDPKHVNASSQVKALLPRFTYSGLMQHLALSQYPIQRTLPDWEGTFEDAPEYGPTRPLRREDFREPESQARIIDALNSFDLQHVVQILPSLLLDEYGSGDGESAVPDTTTRGRRRREKAGSSRDSADKHGKSAVAASSSSRAAAVGGTQVADGWTEKIREDFEGYDADKRDWSHLWGTQMETQVELGGEGMDADFPVDSDDDLPPRGAGSGRHGVLPLDIEILSALSAADAGSGTQVATQWQDTQYSQLALESAPPSQVRTRRGSGSQSSSAAPSPRSLPDSSAPASAKSSASRPRRGKTTAASQALLLETLHEGEESAEIESTPLISQTLSSPDQHLRAIFDKLATVPELFSTQTAARGGETQVPSQSQASLLSQNEPTPASAQSFAAEPLPSSIGGPASRSVETQLTQSAAGGVVPLADASASSASISQPRSLLDLSASTQSGHSAQAGWLDRHQGILTQEERDSLFDWSSQHTSQFLFSIPATAGSSGSAGRTTEAGADHDTFVCVEGDPAQSSVTAAPTAVPTEGAASAAPAPQGPALFSTQEPARNAVAPPGRPSKPSVPTPAGAADSQQSSASLRSPSSQATQGQVVMINNNDSAPNQMMMTKTGKLIAFRPASAVKALDETVGLVGHPVRILTESGFLAGTVEAFNGEVFYVHFENGEREAMTVQEVQRWLYHVDGSASSGSRTQSQTHSARAGSGPSTEPQSSSHSAALHAQSQAHSSYLGGSSSSAVRSSDSDRPPLRPRITSTSAFLYSQQDDAGSVEPASATRRNGGVQATQPEEMRAPPRSGIAYSAGSTPHQHAQLNAILDSDLPRPRAAEEFAASGGIATIGADAPVSAAVLAQELSAAPVIREPRDVAAMSDREVVEYLLEVLPPDYDMPSVQDSGYNVYQALRAIATNISNRQAGQRGAPRVPKQASRRRQIPSTESEDGSVEQEPERIADRTRGEARGNRVKAPAQGVQEPVLPRGRARKASAAADGVDAQERARAEREGKRQRVVDRAMEVSLV